MLAEQRSPTKAELDKLAGYTGWGSFGQELFNGSWNAPRPKPGWEIEDAWLRDQLGEEGWKSVQQSIINAHYTDAAYVDAMWQTVVDLGLHEGRILDSRRPARAPVRDSDRPRPAFAVVTPAGRRGR